MSQTDSFRPGTWRRVVAVSRLAGIATGTLVFALSLALCRVVTRGAARRRVRAAHFAGWSRLMLRTLGGRTVVHGTPPGPPFFLASNHLGYLDILALAQVIPAVFVSKAEVRDWPVIGRLTQLADTLYIDRERTRDIPRANNAIADALARGDSVALFPEGTSSESDRMLPVRPPLLKVAADAEIPVFVAALRFETRPGDPHAHRSICYYGDMVFVDHVWRLLHLRGFTVTVRFAPAPVTDGNRKTLARRVRDAVLALQRQARSDTADAPGKLSPTQRGLTE